MNFIANSSMGFCHVKLMVSALQFLKIEALESCQSIPQPSHLAERFRLYSRHDKRFHIFVAQGLMSLLIGLLMWAVAELDGLSLTDVDQLWHPLCILGTSVLYPSDTIKGKACRIRLQPLHHLEKSLSASHARRCVPPKLKYEQFSKPHGSGITCAFCPTPSAQVSSVASGGWPDTNVQDCSGMFSASIPHGKLST